MIAATAALSSAGTASAGTASAASGSRPARHGQVAVMLLGQQIAAYAKGLVGRYPYKWGGDTPKTGFDCSGLTSYVYQLYGKVIPRTAENQYAAFRKITNGQPWRGDLVFFHDSKGHVYHVGIYEGGGMLVSATDKKDGILYQMIWGGTVSYGTITHLAVTAVSAGAARLRRFGRPAGRARRRPSPRTSTAGLPACGHWPR
jgi:cell wall-associated NlpC family hydrolase